MSIINSANPGSQINLLCLIVRVILRNEGKLTLDDITKLCRPDNLPTKKDHEKRFSENLRFWMQESHKLWHEDDNLKLVLTNKPNSPMAEDIATITSKALHAELYDNIFVPKNHDTTPLFRSLGTILEVDEYTVGTGKILNNKEVDKLFSEYLPKFTPNDSEKKYVLAYGHFLGYLEPAVGGGYTIDETRAVRRVLADLFSDNVELKFDVFLNRLNTALPLLDDGQYRRQVREKIPEILRHDSGQTISNALSVALERLSMSGILRMDASADDPDVYFRRLGEERLAVSRIEFVGKV